MGAASDSDTAKLDFGGNFPEGASESIAAADALAASMVRLQAASEKVKDPKFIQADKINASVAGMDRLAAANAKIAAFDAPRERSLAKQEAILKRMHEDAVGITAAQEKAAAGARSAAEIEALGAGFAAAGVAAKALYDKVVDLRHEALAFATEWGMFGGKLAVDATSKKELQGGIGNRIGGDFDKTRRDALKMGVDPDAAWESTKKLLGDKFSKEEIPGILRIKAGMDLAGQNGEGLVTELQKLKLEPKIKSADIDRLYKMGIDSKLVYADLAKKLGTDIPTAMAKVKAGTVDTGEAIKSITKVANEKFGGLTDILGNTIPALIARVKGEAEDMFDRVDVAPVKKVLKDIIADIEGPQGARLKDSVSRLFGAVFDTGLGDLNKGNTIGDVFTQMTAGVNEAAAAVRSLRPEVKALLDDLRRAMHDGTIKSLVDVGKGEAKRQIEGKRDELEATKAKANLSNDPLDIVKAFVDPSRTIFQPLMDTSETFQKVQRKIGESDTHRILGDDDAPVPKVGKGDAPLLLNGGADQSADAMDAGGNLPAGMAEGIRNGESQAIEAAADMAEKALQAAKDKLLVRSPSEAFAEVGDYSAEGMSGAMASHPGPEAAGKKMAANALGAAKDEAAGGAAKAGAAAGASAGGAAAGSVVYQITMGAGTTDADLARLEAMLRRVDRARREGGSLPAYG